MTMSLKEEALKRKLEKRTEQLIASAAWAILCQDGEVRRALKSGDSSDEEWLTNLAEEAHALSKHRRWLINPAGVQRGAPQPIGGFEATTRESESGQELDTLAGMMAIEAARRDDVVAFRAEVLGGRLLEPRAVPEWMERQAEQAKTSSGQDASGSESATEDDSTNMEWPPLPPWPGRPYFPAAGTLAYPDPVRHTLLPEPHFLTLPSHGPLLRLKGLAATLMQEYPWSEAQATGFVLSGAFTGFSVAVITEYRFFPFRIVLEVDPGLDAEWVRHEYQAAQRRLLQVLPRERYKPQSAKHLRLGLFLAQGRAGTWGDAMEKWNRECGHPEWQYEKPRLFQRDAQTALERLRTKRPMEGEHYPGIRTEVVRSLSAQPKGRRRQPAAQ